MRAFKPSFLVLPIVLTCSCGGGDATPPSPGAAGSAGVGNDPPRGGANNTPTGGASANPSAGSGGASVNMPQAGTGNAGGSGGATPVMPIPVGETPEAKWINVTGTLAGMPSECGNLGRVSAHPTADLVLVGVAQKGLFGSTDGGSSWKPLGAKGAVITNRISYVAYDPAAPSTFWESGIYNDGGVYKTTDSGATFTQVGDVTHCDSVSVDFSDPKRMTLLAGSHEQSRKLFRSTDGGADWEDIGEALPADSGFCTTSTILDAKTFVVGCGGWYGGDPGIHRTTDGGKVFAQVSDVGVAGQPLRASDGAIYWAGHQGGGLYKSTDQGQHFTQVAEPENARSVEPIELPDGRIVTVGATTLMISANHGMTWEELADPLPFTPSGVTYSAVRNAFYVWQWDCEDVVLPDAIMRFGFDYRK
jgi:photosystem II stability/assembly factor-like uncharacterized protein